MKDKQLIVHLNQLSGEVEKEINTEKDCERNCRLHDVIELLRRAAFVADGSVTEPNDLISDVGQAIQGTNTLI